MIPLRYRMSTVFFVFYSFFHSYYFQSLMKIVAFSKSYFFYLLLEGANHSEFLTRLPPATRGTVKRESRARGRPGQAGGRTDGAAGEGRVERSEWGECRGDGEAKSQMIADSCRCAANGQPITRPARSPARPPKPDTCPALPSTDRRGFRRKGEATATATGHFLLWALVGTYIFNFLAACC